MIKIRNPNGYGSISKLSGKRRKPFMVRITIGFDEYGKQLYKILGYFAKRTEAIQYLADFNASGSVITEDITLEQVYERFTEHKYIKEGKPIPPTYRTAYKRLQKLYKDVFNRITIYDYEPLMDAAPSYNTKRDLKVLLQQMYKYAIKHDIVEKNIAEYLETPSATKSEKHKPFTDDEVKLLWQLKDNVYSRLYLIYCYTGLRPTELLEIKTKDVNLKEQYMVGGIKNDYSKNRLIPLADCIVPIVESFYTPNMEFLINIDGKPIKYQDLFKLLKDFCKEYNLDHLPHDGRHTLATKLGEMIDVPTRLIANILGHVGDNTATRTYIHKSLPTMLEVVNRIPTYV